MTTIAMNNLWNYIQGLSLTARNREWLAARLQESSRAAKQKDDTLMTKEEFFAGIDEAREQIRRGEGVTFTNLDEMNAWLNALGTMYTISYSPRAQEGLSKLKKNEPASFKKAVKLLNEIAVHPFTGTGHPEPLKGDRSGQWSRTITKKHRLVYEVFETEVHIDVLSSYGHYDDK